MVAPLYVERFLGKLKKVRKDSNGWTACCPVHEDEDSKPSLNIAIAKSDGKILVNCKVGCTHLAIVKAVGLEERDLWPPTEGGRILATYIYRDANGVPRYRKVRTEPKGFYQERALEGGGWEKGTKDVEKLLYRLPELIAADPNETVFVVEGEKAVAKLGELGLIATCAGGAKSWRQEFAGWFKNRNVVVLPDNDSAGEGYGKNVVESIKILASRVKLIQLPDLPIGGDVVDWLANGGTKEALIALADAPAHSQNGQAAEPIFEKPEVESVMAFPTAIFPDELEEMILSAARSFSCAPDFIAVPMLVTAACIIGGSRILEIKRGWKEGARIYAAIIGEPGSTKTPAINFACRPVRKLQERLADEWENERAEFDQRLDEWEQAKKNKAQAGSKPKMPAMRRVYSTDATTESLAVILRTNPRGVVLLQDELTGWMRSMDQYRAGGRGSDRQFYLKTWSGTSVIVDRKGHLEGIPISVRSPFISIVGGIQPDMLSELADHRSREDGFIHRMLFAYPEVDMAPDWNDEDVPLHLMTNWEEVSERLWNLSFADKPEKCFFNQEAKAAWEDWHNQHSAEMRGSDFKPVLQGPWAKFKNYLLRFALTMHWLHAVCGGNDSCQLGEESVIRAGALTEYFKDHARKVYAAMESSSADKRTGRILTWIRQHGGECTPRDLVRAGFCKRSSEARSILEDLVDRGFGILSEMKNPSGSNTLAFRIHGT